MQLKWGWLYILDARGGLGSPYQAECHSEPFLFRKPGPDLEGALRCGLGRAGQDSLSLP